jgi:glycosyltransferase involved in cell wall biosynthesis
MRVLHLNFSDISGGASRAAYRLHQGLQEIGISSQILVQEKVTEDHTVFAPPTKLGRRFAQFRTPLSKLPLEIYRHRESSEYSVTWLPDTTVHRVKLLAPDFINLHWIGGGFLQIESITKFKKPLIWTLHDMWAFTGGCHYSQDCDRYTRTCGKCPQLGSHTKWDLSRWEWQRKDSVFEQADITVVAPSLWLAKCARASSLLNKAPVQVIPNGVDITKYKPLHRRLAREMLNLPQDKQLVLFIAMKATSDKRKGFHLLQPMLQSLSRAGWQDKLELVIVGSSRPSPCPEFGLKDHYLGKVTDEIALALIYSAADVFITPAVQDNLPNTVIEATACGIPCVAFDIGGMSEMIEHQFNGYLAKPYQIDDFARGVVWVLEDSERHEKLSLSARYKSEKEFNVQLQAKRYQALYEEIANSKKSLSKLFSQELKETLE